MTMRKMKLIYVCLLGLVIVLTACVDEDIVKTNKYDIEEGIPVVTSLKFGVENSKVVTRSAASETIENTVTDLFVIAFNSSGNISSYRSENGENVSGGKYYGTDSSVTGVEQGTINDFGMYSGQNQTIYAIANVAGGYADLTSAKLLDFNGTETDFLNLACNLNDDSDIERGIFLMSGKLEDFAINTDGQILSENSTIDLERLEARITFKVKIQADAEHLNMKFTPRYYRVRQFSQGAYLFAKTKNENDNSADYTEGGYRSVSSDRNFETSDEAGLVGFFEFYVWENRLNPRNKISSDNQGDAESLYALREKRDQGKEITDPNKPGQTYELGEFTYANANSTYVEMLGELYYETEDGNKVSADVTYTVHLGNTGTTDDANNVPKVNNYDTERNTHYIYTVTLAGVNSMYVEVYKKEENRPGMEGDVTATQNTLTFDAHYGRTSFVLNKADFTRDNNNDGKADGLSWSISTPFQNGTKEFNADNYLINGNLGTEEQLKNKPELQTNLDLNDYRWIQFVINSEAIDDKGVAVPNSEFAKYPGYLAYSQTDLDKPASAFGNEGWYHQGTTAYYSRPVPMYDINQLLNHLYLEAKKDDSPVFDEDGNVTITAFIDEYVYIYDPRITYYRLPVSTTAEKLTLWKDVVNRTNRTLSISYGVGRQYSPDGNTSWQTASIIFSQMPIRTFYNPQSVSSAWGVESDVETGNLVTYPCPNSLTESTSSKNNGRDNTLKIVTDNPNLRWSQVLYMGTTNWGHLQNGYDTIWYACLGRNRDLNGDDIVQADEIRWYLASIDQLTALWIGENALPSVIKLYDVSKVTSTKVPHLHVASSSLYNNDYVTNQRSRGNVDMIWAEEGASRGDVNRSYTSNEDGYSYDYRCVRNLGISLANINTAPDDYVQVNRGSYSINGTTYNEYIIDVSRLDPNTIRAASPNMVLGSHTERQDINRPASKFAVINDQYWKATWNDVISETSTVAGRICPTGYRLPNQRELLLLSMYFGSDRPEQSQSYDNLFPSSYGGGGGSSSSSESDRTFYPARTEYGYASITGRPGFGIESANSGDYTFLLLNSKPNFFVRCVRDLTE